jgi:serine/threonine protein kinase
MQPYDPRLHALRDQLPGQVLQGTRGARYHVREQLGEGGQGWVFRANWDEPDGYAVIVKVLRPDAVTPEALARFQREATVMRMLAQAARPNPHIVRFFDHATAHVAMPGGEPIALPFTVLEYVRGDTLEHALTQARGVGIALDRTRRIARQVALALQDVHAHKIVHRDLKPSNVLLATEGGDEIAKVTDFGLVKLVEVSLGRTTALAGASLGYSPPEQFEQGNQRVGVRSDVFSFASMLYEMLTGTRAFPYGDQENPLVIVTRLLNGPRPSLARGRGGLPQELATRTDVIERLDAQIVRATAAEPQERHSSIGEFWEAVEPLLRAATERRSFAAKELRAAAPVQAQAPRGANGKPAETLDTTSRQTAEPPDADAQLANPAAWTWRVCAQPSRAGTARIGAFEPSGSSAVAIGPTGLVRWEGAAWSNVSPSLGIDARAVRGVLWMRGTEILLFGARGLVARALLGGGIETWNVPDREVTFLGAHADDNGTITLVGERPARRAVRGGAQSSTMGTIAQFARGKLTLLSDASSCARLRAVTRLRGGAIVACGDSGALVRLELGVPEHVGSICAGNLQAIAALDGGGALTVGVGGHALSLSPRLEAQLEAVQTTRDLLALALDPTGAAWAGSAQARLLRRTGGSWVRMSGDIGIPSSVVAMWAAARTVRAVCDDGAVIEGTVATG